jgi:DNA-nicking Smr family endonuclease
VKKKYIASSKDKKDWLDFTKQIGNISPKENDLSQENIEIKKVLKLDLHGSSLTESNKMVKKFINECFNRGYKKLLIVTGRGLRSKSYDNPYVSEKLSVLKYSVPEFIKNDENLNNKISRISKAEIKDGGEGAIYIFLKNNKKITK